MARLCIVAILVAVVFAALAAAHKFSKPHEVHQLGQHDRRNRGKRHLQANSPGLRGTEIAPLFPGYGTHFVYAYIGTPPQRQSLIVDTGSHYTAFPCVGCTKCGKHIDSYFDVKNSSTALVPKCKVGSVSGPCNIEQSYSEGSSWKAYKVQDQLWVGSIKPSLLPGASDYSIDFEFGCQTSAQGLFEAQLADGILGMSNGPSTLPAQLKTKGVTSSSVFALCFRIGGGIMTLGGVDERLHTKRAISYAAMANNGRPGFYTVNVRNIFMRGSGLAILHGRTLEPISQNASYLLGPAASAIVDSGTTDTYLPSAVAADFKATLKQMTGLDMQMKNWKLTKGQLAQLPSLVFRLQAVGPEAEAAAAEQAQSGKFPSTYAAGTTVDVAIPWSNYLDNTGPDTYAMRIGFTEERGAMVLGSNFMAGYNVIFDSERAQIGFAQSTCNFAEFDPLLITKDDNKPALLDPASGPVPSAPNGDAACTEEQMVPASQCSAQCVRNETAYISTGTQQWKCVRAFAAGSSLDPEAGSAVDPRDVQERPCQESCAGFHVVRGDPHCPDRPWSDCTHGCVKSRQVVPAGERLYSDSKHSTCNYHLQTSACYAGSCPLQQGDYLVYIDLRVRIEPWKWSYVHTEHFFTAIASFLKININNVELLNDAGNEYTASTKLHFKIRLKAKDYKDVAAMHNAAENVVVAVRSPSFGAQLVRALDAATKRSIDWSHLSRFGWMYGADIEVLSAIAMPTSGVRAPQGEEGPTANNDDDDGAAWNLRQANLLLLGVGLTAVVLLGVVIYMYFQLRQAHALYEKDKGSMSRSGQVLHRMLNTLASQAAEGIAATAGVQVNQQGPSASQQHLREVELSQQKGLMDADLED